MIFGQTDKVVVVIKPQSIATDATATGSFDTLGYSYAQLDVVLDSSAAVSNNPAVLAVSEGDTTTAYTDVTALVGDGSGGFTVPNVHTANATVVRLNIDLKKRKRYLKLSQTSGGAANISTTIARLSRAAVQPDTTTEAGVTALVNA